MPTSPGFKELIRDKKTGKMREATRADQVRRQQSEERRRAEERQDYSQIDEFIGGKGYAVGRYIQRQAARRAKKGK